MAPLIGISSWRGMALTDGVDVPHLLTDASYARAVEKAGGLTVVLPELAPDDVDVLLDRVDGVVLVGGPDVNPSHFDEPALPTTDVAPIGRDAFDLALARRCVERDHPLLAICRGVQVLNVALGGSLAQDVPEHSHRDRPKDDVHEVTLEPGSRCAAIVGTTRLGTNSLHHQTIGRTGDGVRTVGRTGDGTIEAIEIEDAPRVLGIQWHPELLRHHPDHLALFADLVRTAEAQRVRAER